MISNIRSVRTSPGDDLKINFVNTTVNILLHNVLLLLT